ncbi:MAG: DUF4834 family protein [Rikenellaceae bacterium]|nr:DUF4834 family protein [Rikenellaceae bacterium]
METFISFILISILVIYLAAQLGKWLLRRWIVRKQREFAEQFGRQAGGFGGFYAEGKQQQRRSTATGEGEIRIQRTKREVKKVSRQVGDYVDFEEVDQ